MYRVWKIYRDTPLAAKLATGFVLGLIVAIVFGSSASVLSPLGELFLRLLQMIIIPLVMLTLIGAVNGASGSLARIGPKAFVYYLATTMVAAVLGLGAAMLVNPGVGLSLPTEPVEQVENTSVADTLLGIVPANIAEAFVNVDMLALIFLAIIVGLAIAGMRHAGERKVADGGEFLLTLVHAGKDAIFKILDGILQYAPIGVFALAAATIGGQSFDAIVALGQVSGVYLGSVVVQMAVVYILLLVLFRINVIRFFKNSFAAMLTAFTTGSSSATLPVTLRCARRAGLADSTAGFTLPLGATVNMDGAAIRLGVYAVLAANIAGEDLSFATMAGIVLTATLVSIGAAGIPGGGPVVLSILLTQAGLPLEVVGLVAGIDILLNMASTMCNVTGDLVGAHVIDKTEEKYRVGSPPSASAEEPTGELRADGPRTF